MKIILKNIYKIIVLTLKNKVRIITDPNNKNKSINQQVNRGII